MLFVIKRITLNSAKLLSVVDKGASGDDDNRPSIVLFKRKKEAAMPQDEKAEPVEKAEGLAAKIGAIDEQNFNDEQKAFVLKLLEASMGGSPAPEAPPIVEAPAEKAEGDEEDPADEDPKPEDEEMTKRHKAETIELQKRIDKLESESAELKTEAETVKLEKRADELKFLPMSREESIKLIKQVGGTKEGDAALDKLNKASMESPLLKAAGAVVQDGDGSAQATLNKRVKVLQDKDPDLNTDAAEMRVLKSDDKLYTEIRRERN